MGRIECTQTLPLSREGREAISERFSTQMQQIQYKKEKHNADTIASKQCKT